MKRSLVCLLAAVLVTFGAEAKSRKGTRPNIILIYTDDQGHGDASCLNPDAKFQTPNLDQLAREGISFTDGHSSDTVCTPSRYGLLTGRYCWRTTKKAGVLKAEGPCLIESGRITIASLLRDNGYHTAMVGKWHLGFTFPEGKGTDRDWSQPVTDMPLDKGFDYFYGIPASLNYGYLAWFEGRHAKVPPTLWTGKKQNDRDSDYRIKPPYLDSEDAARKEFGKNPIPIAADFIDEQCLTRFTDKAIEWMGGKITDAKNGNPFFIYLPFTSPHYPVCPKPEFWGQGKAGGYGEFMIETDYHVGRVLDFIKKAGLDENTMIIYTSDNGPEKTWKERITEFNHDSSGIYSGGKRDIEEGGHRVPFFIRWPAGIVQPGRSWDRQVGQTDLLATLAEMLGTQLPPQAGEDSESFYAALRKPTAVMERAPIINHSSGGNFAIRKGDWKLVMPHKKKDTRELYNLAADPAEQKNVIKDAPEIAEQLEKQITDIICNGRTTPGTPQSNDTGWWKDLVWIPKTEYEATQSK